MHRAFWLIVPGLLSGLITGASSVYTMRVQMEYMQREVNSIKTENRDQDQYMQRNRELIYRGARNGPD